jgi:hypothetical protein
VQELHHCIQVGAVSRGGAQGGRYDAQEGVEELSGGSRRAGGIAIERERWGEGEGKRQIGRG